MNKDEALRLLERELDALRAESYEALVRRIDEDPVVSEHVGTDAATYQLEIQVLWDGRPGGNVRVMGGVDDGRWRALAPVTRSFIKSADGRFVDEV